MRIPPETKVEELALKVAEGHSLRAAAKALGIAYTTSRRWAAEPTFAPQVTRFRGQIIGRAVGILATASVKAATATLELLDKSTDPDIRQRAVRGAIADLIALQTHHELATQLRELEAPPADDGN